MLRLLGRALTAVAGLTVAAAALPAAVLTDDLGSAKRVSLEAVKPPDAAIWAEYGLAEAETGRYEAAGRAFAATAWRMQDPTGAQAAFRWLKPAEAKPAPQDFAQYSPFAVHYGGTILMTHGNYVVRFEGGAPTLDELKIFLFQLPKLDQSGLPPVLSWIPQADLVPGSDRFINGPASLEKFFPGVPPATAGFHFGTEAVFGRYKGRTGETEMAIFYYPANPMARERQTEFEKIPGALVKRTGPLLAVIARPRDPDDAQRLLSQVNYRASVTINQRPAGPEQNAGDMLIAIFQLTGLLLALTLLAGVLMFAARSLRRRMAGGKDEDPMTLLHLEDRQ